MVTGKDLAQICRQQFPKPIYLTLWVMAEIAIIGSDVQVRIPCRHFYLHFNSSVQEVIGSAIALKLLFGIPIWAGALITICDTFTFLFIHICGVRSLEVSYSSLLIPVQAFFAFLVGVMAACFFANLIAVAPPIVDILGGFIPRIPEGAFDQTVGLVGAVIMPHNLFLHSALVLSRQVPPRNKRKVREANKYFSIEAAVSLIISFFINMAVIATFAYFHNTEQKDLDLESAATALEDTFGNSARIVWAIGLLAAGQSSTMTGTYAGQFVMMGFLKLKIPQWARVVVTRSIAIIPALCVTFISSSPDGLDE